MDLQLEQELYQRFLQKEKVARFLWMLESPERRSRIFEDLRDVRYFDEKSYEELTGQDKSPTMIIDRLKNLGVMSVIYIISSNEDDDGTEQVLEPYINTKIWQTEEVIGYCRKSKVGFFKNHEGWFYLLSDSK
ncbi:hypothetical protein [Gimesia maris]|jgi:hypothetical protein|uniref:Uncharacterized protein n=1 Tax=Gimesia maris TaxID=122 RepID=A0A3D3R501_9PLAN|nr:hypothetical protein [Gimesia maris]MAC54079.1 hypothetical protein [Gimesia sp.]QDT77474.1 hypothetical protein Mal35_09000 [Gimesia maris]HCO22690.1 hypothetical protein [Gimesia maris]|tara:strand:- start:78367 stop:78765 length:399 start_codon:yes stop_codon:yes gene_type:complete